MNSDNTTFFIRTLGCKVNQYESQAMRELLGRSGFTESEDEDSAGVYIINTCTVTHKADREARYIIGQFRKKHKNARIVVTGCYAENDAAELAALPGVTLVVKNSEKSRIADLLGERPATGDRPPANLSITDFKDHAKAFVKIQDGCNNFCSYCKVPLVRGLLWSRPVGEIVEEVKGLVTHGFREVILTGICLGAWGADIRPIARNVGLGGPDLIDVLEALDAVSGDFRIRLSSIEPKYVDDRLLAFMAAHARMCRHLHVPLQSGDDGILKRMNRPYTAGGYQELIDRARQAIDDVAITTDVMIGFPGESEASFARTLEFVKGLAPARTHIFTYSKREGTAASRMADRPVDSSVLKKRYADLERAAKVAAYAYRSAFINKEVDVLVEHTRDKESGLLAGYSDNYIRVLFDGPDSIMRKVVPVKIREIFNEDTMGEYGG